MSGSLWIQTGANLVASRTPLQWERVTGGINLRVLVGGEAYGTPKNASTGDRDNNSDADGDEDIDGDLRGIITPRNAPYFVFTWRGLNGKSWTSNDSTSLDE